MKILLNLTCIAAFVTMLMVIMLIQDYYTIGHGLHPAIGAIIVLVVGVLSMKMSELVEELE